MDEPGACRNETNWMNFVKYIKKKGGRDAAEIEVSVAIECRGFYQFYQGAAFVAGDAGWRPGLPCDTYEDILTQIRNWLYLKLPHGKYDSKLDEYGFEVWNKPPVHKLYPPGGLRYKAKAKEFSWKSVKAAESYELQISYDGGDTWKTVYKGDKTKAGVVLKSMQVSAQVRSLKESSPEAASDWCDDYVVDARVPEIPTHMRWAPASYHDIMMALIEWDIAERADEYELDFSDNGGDEVYTGPNTYDYDDIMGNPGEHRYNVRAYNKFGWSEPSEELVIVIE